MVHLEMRFLTGRYHATPWGSHPNEGLVEWPPFPWRLMRSFIATWHWKARTEIDEQTIQELLHQLSTELPSFSLPTALVQAHTRHYMPLYKDKTTKLFDSFIHLNEGESVHIHWPDLELSESLLSALDILLERMGYFGRAESWVELIRVTGEELLRSSHISVIPKERAEISTRVENETSIRLLAPVAPSVYDSWLSDELVFAKQGLIEAKKQKAAKKNKAPKKVKLTKKEEEKIDASFPPTLFQAFQAETGLLQKAGWSQPPGSRWVDYVQQSKPTHANKTLLTHQAPQNDPQVAIFGLSGSLRPRFTHMLEFAEKIHKCLVSFSPDLEVFHGHQGEKLSTEHRHAFILPQVDQKGWVEQIILYAPMGFNTQARSALEQLHKVWMPKSYPNGEEYPNHLVEPLQGFSKWSTKSNEFRLILMGFGGLGDVPTFGESKKWRSLTPFVPTRHPKRKNGAPKRDESGLQIGSVEHDLRRLLHLNYNQITSENRLFVERIQKVDLGGRTIQWSDFQVKRKHGEGRRAGRRGYGFRLEFEEPVQGPLVVGYGAHFGLGLFVPD